MTETLRLGGVRRAWQFAGECLTIAVRKVWRFSHAISGNEFARGLRALLPGTERKNPSTLVSGEAVVHRL
jgi:hypothetical protein